MGQGPGPLVIGLASLHLRWMLGSSPSMTVVFPVLTGTPVFTQHRVRRHSLSLSPSGLTRGSTDGTGAAGHGPGVFATAMDARVKPEHDTVCYLGVGASSRIKPSPFKSAHNPLGTAVSNTAMLRATSSGAAAPGMTETMAGWP